jgi:hypothetical protein
MQYHIYHIIIVIIDNDMQAEKRGGRMGNLQSTTIKNKLKIKQRSQRQPSGKTQQPLKNYQKGSCEWDGEKHKTQLL